ncbi:AraC family transcriptional regulator [Mucilaginibacter aquaedulcis]|uniref:AraC family transcriptional regulator n=1 Tax=Mucilaginibacter aquaedulcis TaxID=1187081 RepID=UPI0025B5CC6D|nr:helix-turn-helix domain-containing protein [Mucilaginibacter aquaedulcis]MDN3548189.1 helix-turn-helix domain-containing protein [Mucilaginibacter aquaedulcis]
MDVPHFPVLDINEFRQGDHSETDFLYHEIIGRRFIEKPHKHDFFLIMLFEFGGGTHTIDFVDHQVADFQLHMLFPEQVHKWDLSEKTHAHQIMISRSEFEAMADSLRFSLILYQNFPVINLGPKAFKKILYEFELIKSELATPAPVPEIISTRIRLIALMVSREAENIFNDLTVYKTKPLLFRYRSLIGIHYKKEKLVAFYADQLNISPNYLNILCKRHFHISATALIHERLILESKRLLLTTETPLKIIAFELGFYDVAYFSKFFKKYTKITPHQFRKQS